MNEVANYDNEIQEMDQLCAVTKKLLKGCQDCRLLMIRNEYALNLTLC